MKYQISLWVLYAFSIAKQLADTFLKHVSLQRQSVKLLYSDSTRSPTGECIYVSLMFVVKL